MERSCSALCAKVSRRRHHAAWNCHSTSNFHLHLLASQYLVVILTPSTLSLFPYKEDKKEAGNIDMTKCTTILSAAKVKGITWPEGHDQQMCFAIVSPKRTFYVRGGGALFFHSTVLITTPTDCLQQKGRIQGLDGGAEEGRPPVLRRPRRQPRH